MQVSRVDITNFLGFREIQIDIQPSLQVIAGPNNAGKSSFVDLLETFFDDPNGDRLLELQPRNAYFESMGPRTLSVIQVWFDELSNRELTDFADIVRRDGKFWVAIRCTRAGSISFKTSKDSAAEVARTHYLKLLEQFHFVKVPTVRLSANESSASEMSVDRLYQTLESVLVRSGGSRSTKLQTRFRKALKGVEDIVKEILDESALAVAADLPFREGKLAFELPDGGHALRGLLASTEIVSEGSVRIPVRDRGTGFQSALVLGILRFVASHEASVSTNVMFAVEEPEAFLHPQTQRAMARVLRSLSEDSQVLITSHSPTIVDSFKIGSVARLPLDPNGVEYVWSRPQLDATTEGRLDRYCSAPNSELVFANAVIFVEGESDYLAVERILDQICNGGGDHYALGLSVIAADGLDKIVHLAALAEHFGVQSFVLADLDGIRRGGGKRPILKILDEREPRPTSSEKSRLCQIADQTANSEAQARDRQAELNRILEQYGTFVMASDLEGLLLSMHGVKSFVDQLTSGGAVFDEVFAQDLLDDPTSGYAKLQQWTGSKGWNTDIKSNSKLKPHLATYLVDAYFDLNTRPEKNLRPLYDWLRTIVEDAATNKM